MVSRFHGNMARRTTSLAELEPSLVRQQGNGETIYRCPYCAERVGIRDRRGHLYVNIVKGIGHCFRCDVIVRITDGSTSQLLLKEIEAWMQEPRLPEEEENKHMGVPLVTLKMEMSKQGFLDIHLGTPELARNYLEERHISIGVAKAANLMYNEDTKKLLFPFLNPYDLVSMGGYGERTLGEGGGWAYNRAGLRNLYFPNTIIARSTYWVFVEGPADALSLASRGFPGVAIGGTVLSESQKLQVGLFFPKYIDIFFDADAASYMGQLATELSAIYRGKVQTLRQTSLIYAPTEKDPSQLSTEELHALLNSDHQIILPPGGLRPGAVYGVGGIGGGHGQTPATD